MTSSPPIQLDLRRDLPKVREALVDAQALLDQLAAEAGARHVSLSLSTCPNGRIFYCASLHIGDGAPIEVKSEQGDTLAEALSAALAKEPFLYFVEAEAA